MRCILGHYSKAIEGADNGKKYLNKNSNSPFSISKFLVSNFVKSIIVRTALAQGTHRFLFERQHDKLIESLAHQLNDQQMK